jgi:AcrR family transcriptional regulator
MRKLSKEIIKNAAIELIKEKGLKEFTARNLGEKLGVTDAAIFKYFPSLRNLFEEILKDFIYECKSSFSHIINNPNLSPEEKLKGVIKAYSQNFEKTKGAMPLLCFEISRLHDVELRNLIKEYWEFYLESIENIIEEGKERGIFKEDLEPVHIAMLINGYFLSKALRELTGEECPQSDEIVNIILSAVLK